MQRKFLSYNEIEYTVTDPRYAVSHHSDVYSCTDVAVSTEVPLKRSRTALPRHVVDCYILHNRCGALEVMMERYT